MLKKLLKGILVFALCIGAVNDGMPVSAASTSDAVMIQLKGSGTLNIYKDESCTGTILSYINISGNYGGDMALIEETSSAYKIKIAGVTGWVSKASGLTPLSMSEAKYPSYYGVNSSNEIYHQISNNPTIKKYMSTQVLGPKPSYLKSGVNYYSYDGNYFYDDYEEMIEDYRNETFRHAVNYDEPYYNYYQYLPMHSKTNLTANDINNYVRKSLGYTSIPTSYKNIGAKESKLVDSGDAFLYVQDVYGTNAALLFAIALNESNNGRSEFAVERNNLFGLGAVDASPTDAKGYATLEKGIETFASVHLNWGFLDYNDSRYNGGHVGDKNSGLNVTYASDPYWGEKAASYYYKLDKYNGLKDYGNETIAIHPTAERMPIRKEASTTSTSIGSVASVSNLSYVVLDEEGKFYKVLLDFHLDKNRSVMKHNESLWYEPYDFSNNYGYILKSDLMIVNDGNGSTIPSGSDNEVVFTDSNLQKAVNQALGGTRADNQIVTEKEAQTITSLTINDAILSFNGISSLNKLTTLVLNHVDANANFSELNDLGRLSDLSISVKQISELDMISKCTSLHKLTIKSDFISSGDDLPSLKKHKSLMTLVIDGGKVSDVSTFEALSATTVEIINQSIPVELSGSSFGNPLRNPKGRSIDLSNASANCGGSACSFTYENETVTLASTSTVTISFDETFSGTVSRFSGKLTTGAAINANLNQPGWQQFDADWVYVENSALVKGWKKISDTWYYFKDSGSMAKGWIQDSSKSWYYMDYTSGKMLTGWRADGSKWYYLNPANGIMQTGWQTIDGVQYYLSPLGDMAVGDVVINGHSYTFTDKGIYVSDNGAVSDPQPEPTIPVDPETPADPTTPIDPEQPSDPTENNQGNPTVYPKGTWVNSNGSYVYQLADGSYFKGWLLENNCWYLLDYESGIMKTGWVASGSVWYYLNPANGIMQLGKWIDDNGSRYYVDISGVMVTGSKNIDGVDYTFAANGVLNQ